MSTSVVSICNQALIALSANLITSITSSQKEAQLCNAVYDMSRRELLRKHPWNFAVKRQELAQSVTAPISDFLYQYTLPADCLRVLEVSTQQTYKIEGRSLLTNEQTIFLRYIYDNQNPSTYDDAFVNVLSTFLAYKIAYAITQSPSQRADLWELFSRQLTSAKYIDATEDIQDQIDPRTASLISVRF